MSSALAAMYGIAKELGLRTGHRESTIRAAEKAAADPGVADPALEDLRGLPFVTIDYERSQDLDQALYIREEGAGFAVYYALADAAHFAAPGDPLFAEAMERGSSYYLPGLTLPMLPECLSEGTVSLLPGQDRRALTLVMRLDETGAVTGTEVVRSVIRSRAKLTYSGVQHFLDRPGDSNLGGLPFSRSLELLSIVGTLRMQLADQRDVVRYDRVGVGFRLTDDGNRVLAGADNRNAVQLHNEQISLLCNVEGARFLAGHVDAKTGLTGVFRIHEPPGEERLDQLVAFIDAVIAGSGVVESRWRWRRESGESLADYVSRLPADPGTRRLAQAIQRQAMVAARPSYYATEPGPHYGIGASAYSRFSAPMRELVGIVTHHFAIAQLDGSRPAGLSAEQVADAVRSGNRARDLQRRVEREVQRVALDQLFGAELELAPAERRRWLGTVMGVTPAKLYVQLDDPPVSVKLYATELGLGDIASSAEGASGQIGGRRIHAGAAISLVVRAHKDHRWVLEPAD